MNWKVVYSENARQDLRDIYAYIADTLLEPMVASNQTNRIMDAADSLDHMPLRHRLYDNEPWRARGLRVFPIDNYIILYQPNESGNIVTIIRIIHGRRDIDKHLKQIGV